MSNQSQLNTDQMMRFSQINDVFADKSSTGGHKQYLTHKKAVTQASND